MCCELLVERPAHTEMSMAMEAVDSPSQNFVLMFADNVDSRSKNSEQ